RDRGGFACAEAGRLADVPDRQETCRAGCARRGRSDLGGAARALGQAEARDRARRSRGLRPAPLPPLRCRAWRTGRRHALRGEYDGGRFRLSAKSLRLSEGQLREFGEHHAAARGEAIADLERVDQAEILELARVALEDERIAAKARREVGRTACRILVDQ